VLAGGSAKIFKLDHYPPMVLLDVGTHDMYALGWDAQ
jgi:hypothetical protein